MGRHDAPFLVTRQEDGSKCNAPKSKCIKLPGDEAAGNFRRLRLYFAHAGRVSAFRARTDAGKLLAEHVRLEPADTAGFRGAGQLAAAFRGRAHRRYLPYDGEALTHGRLLQHDARL